MSRPAPLRSCRRLALAVGLLFLGACSDSGTEPDPGTPTGSLRVTTATTGEPGALDPDGYTLNVGSGTTIGANETKVINGLPLGSVTVELMAVAGNCEFTSAESATVTISESTTAEASFALGCETLPGMYRWAASIGGEPTGTAVADDGTIYVASAESQARLFALGSDGSVAWSFVADEYITGAPAVAPDGTIVFGTGLGTVYTLNPDGTEKWTYDAGGAFGVYGSPAVGPDGTVYVSNDAFLDPPTLHALNADGTLKWAYSSGGRGGFIPAVGPDGTVYLAADEADVGRLIALDSDGSQAWSYETDGGLGAPAVAADGTVYVGGIASWDGTTLTVDGKLYALASDGTLAWSYQTDGAVFTAPAIGADGTIYAMSGGGQEDDDPVGTIYAVNADGSENWTTQLSGCAAESGGPTVGADGTIYAPVGGCVAGGVGILHAYDAAGSELWQFEVGGEFKVIRGASPLTADGTLYVTSQLTGEVYAVKSDSPGLAATAWPKRGGGNANAGTGS